MQRKVEQRQPGQHGCQAYEPKLAIAEFDQPAESIPPGGRQQKRKQPFHDQHQGYCRKQTVSHVLKIRPLPVDRGYPRSFAADFAA